MTDSEFSLIQRYFAGRSVQRSDVLVGIGDDCALLNVPSGQALAITLDTLVAGIHFFPDTDPEGLGHKALAVNLSDLAAMAAEPAWVTLSLTLPEPETVWLEGFCRGFFSLAERFGVHLAGGDTTRGPLAISVQAHGLVPPGLAPRRAGARPGDRIFVTGTPGDAGLALQAALGRIDVPAKQRDYLRQRLERPTPRIRQGLDLRGLASAAIDISDGLARDLGHILTASAAGAHLRLECLPRSPALAACLDDSTAIAVILGGGDDYELCFTVPPAQTAELQKRARAWQCRCTEIGVIEAEPGLRCRHRDGSLYQPEKLGYDHFA